MPETTVGKTTVNLVVSDAAIRESTRILLEVHDYGGRDYSTGTEYLLECIHRPSCLLTDRELKDMRGLDLLDHLRTVGDTTPAVMMIDRIDANVSLQAERLSLKLLEKPPLTSSLLASVQDACLENLPQELLAASGAHPARFSVSSATAESPSWIDNAGTGIAIFDAQHRELNEMVLDIYDAVLSGEPKASCDELFGRLVDFSAAHCAHEENYMRFSGYEGCDQHSEAHKRLAAALMSLSVNQHIEDRDRSYVALQLLRFLKHWLMEHILSYDRQLGAWLNSQAIH